MLPAPAAAARQVLLLVLDGLGWELLEAHRGALPRLDALSGGAIDAVVPSTTAAALPTLTTGLPPSVHGMLGFRFRVGGEILNALRWRIDGRGKAPDPAEVQPHPPFAAQPVPVVSQAQFSDTGFTAAHLRGADLHGWHTPAGLLTASRALLAAGHRLIYAYYDGVDKVAHAHGLASPHLRDELAATDRLVGDLLDVLPAGGCLLVTADHGQVQVGAEGQRSLAELDPFIDRYSGEGRFRSLHARAGAAAALAEAARERFGHLAWVRTRSQLVEEGWLGPGLGAVTAGRLGDVVLAPHGPWAFADPGYPGEQRLESMHGAPTPAEVRVPLLAGRP